MAGIEKLGNIEIRNALEKDVSQISQLIEKTVLEFQEGDLTREGEETLLETITQKAISEKICSDTFQYFIAELNGTIIGVIAIKKNRHLYHLFVNKEYHGLGIAKKLCNVAFNKCITLGNDGDFTVNSSTYAIEFYKKLGFEPTGNAVWENGIKSTPMQWKKQ